MHGILQTGSFINLNAQFSALPYSFRRADTIGADKLNC